MNIFVLDENPNTAAQMLCDCHVRKMCLETAQILSGVMLRRGMHLLDGMPKPQNINHPVIVAADIQPGMNWLFSYNEALQFEYFVRFKKSHKYNTLQRDYQVHLAKLNNCRIDCSTLAKCCGDLDVYGMDIVTAYRKYYTEVKKPHLAEKNLWNFTYRKDWTE